MIKNNDCLVAFAKVVSLGTVHAAALALGLVQTAVSQRIKALERELGVTLFLRSRRGMTLTEEGRMLIQYHLARQELDTLFTLKLKGKQRGDASLTIVGPVSAIATRVAENCEGVYPRFPFLRLHLRSEEKVNRVDSVKLGHADLAVVSPETVPNEMDSKLLKPDRYLLVGSPAWKGRKLDEILGTERCIDFDYGDRTTMDYLSFFSLKGKLGRGRLFVNENRALIRFFSAGIGFGTLTESVAGPYLRSGALLALNRGLALEQPLSLAWYPRPSRPDYFDAVVRALK